MDFTRLIRNKMMQEHIMFVYRGVVTNENSVHLLMLLEKEMEHSEFAFVGRKRLFMFVLESLQNVSRHTDKGRHAEMSLVIYSKTHNGYTVTTGNVLHSSDIEDLKTKLHQINKLQSDEIRSVYRQMLSSAEFTNKGGAGLGLIEMAKKTGNKLDYDFLPIDDEFSYFILSKTVDSGGTGNHSKIEKRFHSEVVSELAKLMAENKIYLLWSGHISPDIRKEVLSFTEMKLVEEDVETNLRKRVFSVLVEILENVAKYSPGRGPEEQFGMPVAIISLEDKIYTLTTGNLILNLNVDQLKEKLNTINEYDKVGLKELFRKTLSDNYYEPDKKGDIGLIDMARKSGSKLIYQFEEINDLYSYYTLKVKVEDKS